MKVMAFQGRLSVTSEMSLCNQYIKQVSRFNYLGCDVSFIKYNDVRKGKVVPVL
jgi:hypothetical protein